jgi:hypothetical protein
MLQRARRYERLGSLTFGDVCFGGDSLARRDGGLDLGQRVDDSRTVDDERIRPPGEVLDGNLTLVCSEEFYARRNMRLWHGTTRPGRLRRQNPRR